MSEANSRRGWGSKNSIDANANDGGRATASKQRALSNVASKRCEEVSPYGNYGLSKLHYFKATKVWHII